MKHIDALVQDCSISIANALEIKLPLWQPISPEALPPIWGVVIMKKHIDGLVQDCSISMANAL